MLSWLVRVFGWWRVAPASGYDSAFSKVGRTDALPEYLPVCHVAELEMTGRPSLVVRGIDSAFRQPGLQFGGVEPNKLPDLEVGHSALGDEPSDEPRGHVQPLRGGIDVNQWHCTSPVVVVVCRSVPR